MTISTSVKSAYLSRKVKTYTALVLAILGIVLAVVAFGLANDQMAVINELSATFAEGPISVAVEAINLIL